MALQGAPDRQRNRKYPRVVEIRVENLVLGEDQIMEVNVVRA